VRPFLKEGIVIDGHDELKLTGRFYPHKSRGEGQFLAVLKRDENIENLPTILYKDAGTSPSKEESKIAFDFLRENLSSVPDVRLIKRGDFISMVPRELPIPKNSVFLSGVCLGEIRGKNLFPHHHLFSAYGGLFKRRVELSAGDDRLFAYLRGEEIRIDRADSGFCAVAYNGATLGGGKISGGVVKNHYPKGLRIKN
jgi:NOL1/NOP2/fmu family ribosome biogenesis protein